MRSRSSLDGVGGGSLLLQCILVKQNETLHRMGCDPVMRLAHHQKSSSHADKGYNPNVLHLKRSNKRHYYCLAVARHSLMPVHNVLHG